MIKERRKKEKKKKKIKLSSGDLDDSIFDPNPRTALQESPTHFRPTWQALHEGRSKPLILVSQMISTSACLAICLRYFLMPNLLFNLEKLVSI